MNSKNLRALVKRMAATLDASGNTTGPISTYASQVDLLKAGYIRAENGRFHSGLHPLLTLSDSVKSADFSPRKKAVQEPHTPGCVCKVCIAERRARVAAGPGGAPARGEALGAAATDPTVRPEGAPPLSNTGETDRVRTVQLVLDGGKLKQVMVRAPAEGEIAHIDTVSFTVSEKTWFKTGQMVFISDDEIIREASRVLEGIFGFGISSQRATGMNFYRMSWVLGDDFGNVCFGGQRGTMQVVLNGHGCINAAHDWEKRLHDFLSDIAVRPVITRLDLAHDDFEGAYTSPEFYDNAYDAGLFTCSSFGAAPNIEHLGNWKNPTGKGRTLAIGKRTSGKYGRFYEKGKEQGDPSSNWFRSEIEFKSSDRVIPFDALVRPSGYFVAAYPCLAVLSDKHAPERIEIKKKSANITFEAALEITHRQFGKHIYAFRAVFEDDAALLDRITNPTGLPKKLKDAAASLRTCPVSLHDMPADVFNLDDHLNSASTFAHRGPRASTGIN